MDSDTKVSGSLLELACAELAHMPGAQVVFRGFCVHYSADDVSRLKEKIVDAAEWFCGFKAEKAGPDLDLASDLCARAVMLLERYSQFSAEQKALAVGAVRYLTFRVDAVPDRNGSRGLADDREVMNTVLSRLGLDDWKVSDAPRIITLPSMDIPLAVQEVSADLQRRRARWRSFRRATNHNKNSNPD